MQDKELEKRIQDIVTTVEIQNAYTMTLLKEAIIKITIINNILRETMEEIKNENI
jgi:hypothetical protein